MPRKKKQVQSDKSADVSSQATVASPENTGGKVKTTTFKPGKEWTGNANGRPKGSRNRFCKAMLNDFMAVWAEATAEGNTNAGKEALRKMRDEKPDHFVRAAMQWVPQEFELGDKTQGAFREIWEALATGKPLAIPVQDDEGQDND